MVYLFLAEGFEEVEALTPVDLLRRAGIELVTVGVGSRTVKGAHGISVCADISEDEALDTLNKGESTDAVILPGGMPGTLNLEASETVSRFIENAQKSGAVIAAICAAPSILGKRGLLREKRAVCYPGFEDALEGAEIVDCGVVRDGRYICGRAAGSALPFALEIIKAMKGEEAAEAVRRSVIAP